MTLTIHRGLLVAAIAAMVPFAAIAPAANPPAASPLTPLLDLDAPGAPGRVFEAPRIRPLVTGDRYVRLAPGALLWVEQALIVPAQLINEVPIPMPAPLGGALAPGGTFVRQTGPAGSSACLTKTEEPRAVDGNPIAVCLVDRDGDGKHERLIVGAEEHEIQPLALRQLGTAELSRVAPLTCTLVIRVVGLANGEVSLSAKTRAEMGGGQRRYIADLTPSTGTPVPPTIIRLRPGARRRVAGLDIVVTTGPHGELWARVGGTPSWVSLEERGTIIRLAWGTIKMI